MQYLTHPGETNGLLLTLNVQIHEYQEGTENIGVKVLIHDQNEQIFIQEGGFAVMPGRKALVSVSKKQVCRINPRASGAKRRSRHKPGRRLLITLILLKVQSDGRSTLDGT